MTIFGEKKFSSTNFFLTWTFNWTSSRSKYICTPSFNEHVNYQYYVGLLKTCLLQGQPPRIFSRLSQLISDAFLGKAWKTASDMVITLPIPFASIYALDTAVLEGFTRARWYHGRLKDQNTKVNQLQLLSNGRLKKFSSKFSVLSSKLRFWLNVFQIKLKLANINFFSQYFLLFVIKVCSQVFLISMKI